MWTLTSTFHKGLWGSRPANSMETSCSGCLLLRTPHMLSFSKCLVRWSGGTMALYGLWQKQATSRMTTTSSLCMPHVWPIWWLDIALVQKFAKYDGVGGNYEESSTKWIKRPAKESTLACKQCLTKSKRVSLCFTRDFYMIVQYVMQLYVHRTCVHLGVHNHFVAHCKESVEKPLISWRKLVRGEVQCSPMRKLMPSEIIGPQRHTFEMFNTKGHAEFMSRFKTSTPVNAHNHVAFCKFQFT